MPYVFLHVHRHAIIWCSQRLCELGRAFYKWGSWGSERPRDLPKIAELSHKADFSSSKSLAFFYFATFLFRPLTTRVKVCNRSSYPRLWFPLSQTRLPQTPVRLTSHLLQVFWSSVLSSERPSLTTLWQTASTPMVSIPLISTALVEDTTF